jgi:hypothetical protein
MARAFIVEMLVPAGGADHDAAAEGEDGADVFNRGFGAVKSTTTSTPARLGAVSARRARSRDVERADAVAALARDFGDEAAGFSFAEYEDEHGLLCSVAQSECTDLVHTLSSHPCPGARIGDLWWPTFLNHC